MAGDYIEPSLLTTNLHCVTSRKSKNLIYTAVEA